MKNKWFILLYLLLLFKMMDKDNLAQQLTAVTVVNGAGACSGSQLLQLAFGQPISGKSGTQFSGGFWNPFIPGDTPSLINEENISKVTEYTLKQNYPNPFNPVTTIKYSLPKESYVEIKVFNILGQELLLLENSIKPIGYHSVIFEAANLSSGTYFYIINAKAIDDDDEFFSVKKFLLLK